MHYKKVYDIFLFLISLSTVLRMSFCAQTWRCLISLEIRDHANLSRILYGAILTASVYHNTVKSIIKITFTRHVQRCVTVCVCLREFGALVNSIRVYMSFASIKYTCTNLRCAEIHAVVSPKVISYFFPAKILRIDTWIVRFWHEYFTITNMPRDFCSVNFKLSVYPVMKLSRY